MPLCAFRVTSVAFCFFTLSSCAQEVTAVPDADIPPPVNAIVSKEKPRPIASAIPRPPLTEQAEVQPPAPGPPDLWVWQRGYWQWTGSNFVWAPGRWAQKPAYGDEWLQPFWEQLPEGGWHFVQGKWKEPR